MSANDDDGECLELARENEARAAMFKAFEPLPENVRSEILMRVAVEGVMRGGLAEPHKTYEGAFMESCATVARLFALGLGR